MPKTTRLTEYEVFKKFLNQIREGKTPMIDGGDYILISKKEYEKAQKSFQNYQNAQNAIYTRA